MTRGHVSPPALLTDGHDLAPFDCGVPSLNDWLRRRALKNNRSGASRTYVLCNGAVVVGYYCLATGAVYHDDAPHALRRNMPDPIPVLVLGRLAVDRRCQNQKIGRAMLRDAALRAQEVAESVGVTAIVVHAISEEARRFYVSCGFVESPLQPMTLCLLMATLQNTGARLLIS
ncbi:gnat family acetyltransferase : GCN5-related N-acetyltransferase OS=Candidatus Contendobacter odensis Run_B_J11 GN=BN874_1270007 PE=4 SV=1: Acetyltransf_7 [Gemmata massiliana]|uniref:N-acetyltransferase domain-containing protein n=1 Tax=Gemmata massiliana TaxID=1210884 RepID=A0A6P2D1V1_9BACT|nr:GNAT family N-acetyltransferase [Gemmata massiliana]VTR93402.1 gnat family acetyltransferase : GCN5-related N-acetyltransferase OS=Candidatus Contendobacter odensis Run_B_J11 GN=BN874_1270007 PE=4 SV=1: Acetyltransf_7 [Gemmata massiliana]